MADRANNPRKNDVNLMFFTSWSLKRFSAGFCQFFPRVPAFLLYQAHSFFKIEGAFFEAAPLGHDRPWSVGAFA